MAFEYKRRGKKNLDENFPSQSPRESGNGRGRGRGRGRDDGNDFSPRFGGGRVDEPPVDRPPVSRPPKQVIQDTEPTSRYFNITEIPSYLGEGKNTIRLMGSVQLKKNSQIQIEILDAKANPIYFEIPNKKQKDGSRLISIWVYGGRTNPKENTAPGNATITIVGTDSNNIPVKWNRTIPVRVDEISESQIIFDEKTIPSGAISSSLRPFINFELEEDGVDPLGQGRTSKLSKVSEVIGVSYQKSTFGDDVILTMFDTQSFNSQMVGGEAKLKIIPSSNPTILFPRQTGVDQPTEFTSSILSVSSSTILQIKDPITGSNGHEYRFSEGAALRATIEYFSSASQSTTQNLQTVGTFDIRAIAPIAGEIHTLRTSVKSKGLASEFESIATTRFQGTLNESTKKSQFEYTIPIPSQHIGDPKTVKVEFLNKNNEPSETFILMEDVVFPGSTTFIGGKGSLITGSIFISNALGSGIEIGGASSGFLRSVGYKGFTSASQGKGPGGFLIYSGSGNLIVGVDQMEGVGFEFVGANDSSHIKFTTSGSGELDIKAEKFFIGTPGSQFVSGSDGKIEISSSDFHLDPISNQLIIGTNATIKSSLTVNQIRTPAVVNGAPSTKANASSSIDSDGFARFASASIAGFEIVSDEIRSSDNALRLKAAGDITASRVLLEGGTITDGVTILGSVTANSIRTPAVIAGNPSTETNASSSIRPDGFARFVSASIGGWDITTASIEGGNLIMRPAGILQTRDFASGLRGWKISSEGNGTAEFENVRIRGTLRTTTFEKESVNAVGGQLWVTNATTLTGSNITANDTTMSVKNASGFVPGEILLSKKVDGTGFQTEYILVNSASIDGDNTNSDEVHGRLYVTRGFGSGSTGNFVGDLASTSQSYDEGQVLVSTGLSGSGYIKMNANPRDTATPFMDIVERTGSGLYDVALRARLGDLSGLSGNPKVFGSTNPGFGLATDNVFLQGGIVANTGSIGGVKMQESKLFTGQGTHGNSNTGFFLGSDSKFSLGDKFTWDGTNLVVKGTIQITAPSAPGGFQSVEEAINAVTESSTAKSLQITTDSSTYAFDNSADDSATPNVISFVISQQNLSATIAGSDITITKAGGSTISTPSLGGTSNVADGSGQQSGSLSFSGLSLGKTDLPLTLSVTKDGITDSTTIFKVQGGSDGTDGTDAVTAFLTNESHTFPANSSGDVSDFSTGVTDIVVFEGITNRTSNYSFSGTGSAGVSFNQSTDTFTITAMGHDSGSLTITAVSASTQLVKTMSLAKSNAGTAGADGAQGTAGLDGSTAKSLVASVSSQVFAFDDSTDTTATPTNIIFSFNQQNLSAALQASDVTITTQGGSSVTNFDFNNTNVTNSGGDFSGIASGSIVFGNALNNGGMEGTKSHFPLTISATKNSLTDTIKIFKVEGGLPGSDGADAVTAFLTNEAHTFAAQADGTIVSFTDASSSMQVFEGVTDKTANYSYSRTGSAGVTSTLSGTNGNVLAISALSHDSGSVVITAVSASTQLAKTMSLVKSKQGTAGLAGSDAKSLQVNVDSQVFAFDTSTDTSATPSSISFIINQQNLSGTVSTGNITITKAGGGTITTPSLGGVVSDGSGLLSGSITFSNGATPGAGTVVSKSDLPITIEVTKDSLDDSIKVFKVEGGADGSDGTDAVTAFLTNENHNFPADSGGTIASFEGGITDVQVFEGVTNKSNSYLYSATASTGTTFSHLQEAGGSAGNSTTAGHNHFKITGLTKDSGSLTINAVSASTRLIKTMSLTRTKQGADGSDGTAAKLLIGSLDSPVFAFDDSSDNTPTPTNIIFSFQQQNLTGTIGASDITITRNGGSVVTGFDFNNSDVTDGTGIVSGSLKWVGGQSAGGMQQTKGFLPVEISCTKDGLTDSVKIFKVEGGSDGSPGSDGTSAVSALLTNDSHTLPLSSSDAIISFAGASTEMIVFEGVTDSTSDYSISVTKSAHITTSGTNPVTITNTTSPFSGSIVLTAVSASTQIAKTMSVAVALQGDDGLDGSSAKLLNIISDSQTFSFDDSNDTSATPSTINFTINQQNLSETIGSSDITITKVAGGTITNPSLGGTVSNGTGTVTFSIEFDNGASPAAGKVVSKSDLPITVAVSKDSLSDSIKIFKIEGGADGAAGADGSDAVTGFLTNESHTIPANAAGSIATGGLNGAITDMIVFEGITDKTNSYKYAGTGSSGVSFSQLQSAGGSSGNATTNGHNHFKITALTKDSGSLEINAISGSGSQKVIIAKTMSFSKSKQGNTGSQGTAGAKGADGAQGNAGAQGAGGSPGAAGAKGATGAQGADNQDFSFLASGLSTVPFPAPAGLVMNSDVFGYHNALSAQATINDFSAFMDNGGNFYLGSGSGPLGAGYFAWDNTAKTLLISGSGVDFAVQEFFFGRGNTSISGSNGNIKITGDVELVGRNTPNPLYFEDFSQAGGNDSYQLSYINQGNNPKIDGTGYGFYNVGGHTPHRNFSTTSAHGHFFGPVLEVGDDDGDSDQLWLSSNTVIPFNPNSLYEIEVRVKRTAGSSDPEEQNKLYAGVTAFSSSLAANGSTTLTPLNSQGQTGTYGSQHYFAASNQFPTLGEWTIYKGYFKGTSNSAGGQHSNIESDPGTLRTGANAFAPMILVNYQNKPGTYYIDYIKVSEFQGGGGSTTISGDAIKAGTIRSNNLSTSAGSLIDLSKGTFKMGGTSSPKLEFDGTTLSVDGTVTAGAGSIGGWTIGANHIGISPTATADNTYGDFTLGSTGYISADQFKISAAGVATFKGVLEDTATFKSGSTTKAFNTMFGVDSDGIFLSLPRFKEADGSIANARTRFTDLEDDIDSELVSISSAISSGGSYSCVLPGTKVITKRGEINIEDTKHDDIIKVFNFETKEWDWSPIDHITRDKVEGWSLIKTESGKELKCSNSHLLYHPDYPNSAIAIDELGVGGELYVADGENLVIDKIKSIETFNEEVEVWNYELDVVHNYVSNGILSHNTSSKLSPSPSPGGGSGIETTLGHQYKKDVTSDINSGDLVKLGANNELQKVTTAKDSNVVGILWEKLELKYVRKFEGFALGKNDISDSDELTPPEEYYSASRKDSFGDYIPVSQTGSKEIWKVASIGDSVTQDESGSFVLPGFKLCNQGGDVSKGDLLCSSDTPGYLMKQPSEWVVTSFSGSNPVYEERQSHTSYTVAKCMISSSWDSNGRMENVYGYLYCG
tara:strand:+ start:40 stop:9621 length:9582 start_codon:yes stop_codon:yes gene_type:complete